MKTLIYMGFVSIVFLNSAVSFAATIWTELFTGLRIAYMEHRLEEEAQSIWLEYFSSEFGCMNELCPLDILGQFYTAQADYLNPEEMQIWGSAAHMRSAILSESIRGMSSGSDLYSSQDQGIRIALSLAHRGDFFALNTLLTNDQKHYFQNHIMAPYLYHALLDAPALPADKAWLGEQLEIQLKTLIDLEIPGASERFGLWEYKTPLMKWIEHPSDKAFTELKPQDFLERGCLLNDRDLNNNTIFHYLSNIGHIPPDLDQLFETFIKENSGLQWEALWNNQNQSPFDLASPGAFIALLAGSIRYERDASFKPIIQKRVLEAFFDHEEGVGFRLRPFNQESLPGLKAKTAGTVIRGLYGALLALEGSEPRAISETDWVSLLNELKTRLFETTLSNDHAFFRFEPLFQFWAEAARNSYEGLKLALLYISQSRLNNPLLAPLALSPGEELLFEKHAKELFRGESSLVSLVRYREALEKLNSPDPNLIIAGLKLTLNQRFSMVSADWKKSVFFKVLIKTDHMQRAIKPTAAQFNVEVLDQAEAAIFRTTLKLLARIDDPMGRYRAQGFKLSRLHDILEEFKASRLVLSDSGLESLGLRIESEFITLLRLGIHVLSSVLATGIQFETIEWSTEFQNSQQSFLRHLGQLREESFRELLDLVGPEVPGISLLGNINQRSI